MSEEPRGKSSASRWMIWSIVALVAYFLSVGPMDVLWRRFATDSVSWRVLRYAYKPMRVLTAYPPILRGMHAYVYGWLLLTGTDPRISVTRFRMYPLYSDFPLMY